jgi:hypothetical protein
MDAQGAGSDARGDQDTGRVATLNPSGGGVAVVELFTSEGCSSCPPADEALAALIEQAHKHDTAVYALAWHVDYWDYLGWEDPYGLPEASARQRSYARNLDTGLYTPQAIVNGTEVVSYAGSLAELSDTVSAASREGARVRSAPNGESSGAAPTIALGPAVPRDGRVELPHDVDYFPEGAWVLLAVVEKGLRQDVTAGENRGKTLTHQNVVRAFARLDTPQGRTRLELPDDLDPEQASVIAFVQEGDSKRIVAAARRELATAPSTVTGSVVDGEGNPAAGVRVLVCSDYVCVPGQSGPDGAFSISGVPAGSYRIVVGTVSGSEVARISLGSGETLELAEPVRVE